MGGVLGGSQKTATQIPAWLAQAAQKAVAQSGQAGQIGFTPWQGPDVAALAPGQTGAIDNNNAALSAFGLAPSQSTMPPPVDYGGVQGYSAYPIYQQGLNAFKAAAPGQYSAIAGMFIDPVTGQVSGAQPQAPVAQAQGGGSNRSRGSSSRVVAQPRTPNAGGYTGLLDMVNGGGPGASGSTFSGGGILSNFANRRFTPWGSR